MPAHHNKRGFTLIETIIYIGLFGILMSGIFVTIHPLIYGAEHISASIAAESEAAFILRKIDWAFATIHVEAADTVTVNETDDTITLNPTGPGATVVFKPNGTDDGLIYDDGDEYLLNAERVAITDFTVTDHPASGGLPRYIEYSFRSGGLQVGPVREYLQF